MTSISGTGSLGSTGLTFTDNGNGTATLSGTPAAGSGGTYPLSLTATNGVTPNATQTLTVTVNQAPVFTSANAATFKVGTPGSFNITTSGFPAAAAISFTGSLGATGLTFTDNGNGTATLSGTPTAGSGGVYALSLTANNGITPNGGQTLIVNVNQPPAFTSAGTANFQVGQPGTFSITTSGVPAVTSITSTGSLGTTTLTFTDNGNGTATLSGTPAANSGGTYTLNLTAANGVTPNGTQTLTVNVTAPPAITSANNVTFAPGKTGQSFTFTTTGFPTGASMAISQSGTRPTGVTFTDNGNGTATIGGTPAAGTQGNAGNPVSQAYALTLGANNGIPPPASQAFTLNITCPAITVSGGTSLNLIYNVATTATYTQTGGNGTIVWSAPGLPTNLTINSSGQVSGTPNVTGNFSATITATDAGGCIGTKAVTVVLGPSLPDLSFPDVGNTQFFVTGVGGAPSTPAVSTTSTLLASATPVAVSTVVTAASCSTGGTLSAVDATGHFIFTPNVSATSATCSYTVSSNTGAGSTGPASASAALLFNLSANKVWYVDNASTGTHDGRSNRPFLNMTSLSTAAGDYIYVSNGTGNTTGAYSLLANQRLIGAGATLSVGGILTVTGAAANTPTLSGTLTLANNVTVSGIDISTGAANGITGTSVTGVNVTPRDVTTASGTAVNIGGSGNTGTYSFRSVSSKGASSGISLANMTGAFTVTGDGTSANNSSGGTIQSSTSNGISLTNVQNISFNHMNIQNTTHSGVNGTQVTNFAFTNGTINNSGNGSFDSHIAFNGNNTQFGNNINGSLTVTGNTLTNAFYSGLDVQSDNGTVTDANVSNNTITNTTQGQGINFSGINNSSTVFNLTRATIDGNNITQVAGTGIQAQCSASNTTGPGAFCGVPGDATKLISITNNTVVPKPNGAQAITVANSGGNPGSRTGTNFVIQCNGNTSAAAGCSAVGVLNGSSIGTVILVGNNGYADMTGIVDKNVIVANHTPNGGGGNGIAGGNGVAGAGNAWTPLLTLTVTNNTISKTDGNGILLVGRSTSGFANMKFSGNTVGAPVNVNGTAREGIRVDAGNANSADDGVCATISGNTSAGSNGAGGIGIRKQGTVQNINAFGITGLTPSPATGPQAAAFVAMQNPNGGGVDNISGDRFQSCTTAPI